MHDACAQTATHRLWHSSNELIKQMTSVRYCLQIWRRSYIDPIYYKITSVNWHESEKICVFHDLLKVCWYALFWPLKLGTKRFFFMNCFKYKESAGSKPSTFYDFQCYLTVMRIWLCSGMARFSLQRQFWTRQPTNVKVSKDISILECNVK